MDVVIYWIGIVLKVILTFALLRLVLSYLAGGVFNYVVLITQSSSLGCVLGN